jgi:hypothetical protein
MNTVVKIAQTRKPAIALVEQDVVKLFDDGKNMLLRATNSRGDFEILLADDTRHIASHLSDMNAPTTLEGFFRRRSGLRTDGTKHFIWTFCPTNVQKIEKMAA